MALFNVFGKYLAKSGGPHILNGCLVLVAGSTKGFLSGKSYKRCKRIHELLALAMERLHLSAFLESSQSSSEMSSVLSDYLQSVKGDCDDIKSFPEELGDILGNYLSFARETSEGNMAKHHSTGSNTLI